MALTIGTNPDAFGIWSKDDQRRVPWDRWLDAVVAAGYSQIEIGSPGYLPADATRLRDELAARGLTALTGYVGRISPDPARRDAILAQASEVGAWVAGSGGSFVLGIAGFYRDDARQSLSPMRYDGDDWVRLLRLLEDVAAVAHEAGLRFAFHPHIDTAIERPDDVDGFLEATNDTVGLCLDTGQMAYRGSDPVDVLRRWAPRVNYVHLRDLDRDASVACHAGDLPFERAVRSGLFCDPGSGTIDLVGFAAAVAEMGYQGPAVVERSLLGSTIEEATATAVRAREHYERIGLVAPS